MRTSEPIVSGKVYELPSGVTFTGAFLIELLKPNQAFRFSEGTPTTLLVEVLEQGPSKDTPSHGAN